jgi:gliding motility-associated-like protein
VIFGSTKNQVMKRPSLLRVACTMVTKLIFRPGTRTFLVMACLVSVISSRAQIPVLDWAKSIGGSGIDMGHSIAYDASGNVYVVGRFEGTADFDPGAGTFNITSTTSGTNDIFVLKLDATGNFVWAKNMGSTGDDQGLSIALDASGNVYTTGWFQNTADFDPGTGVFNLTSLGSFDVFVSKLDGNGNFIWAKSIGGTDGDVGRSITVDASGNAYISGFYSDVVDFDPGADAFNLTPVGPGTDDVFILKLNAFGNFVWAKSMGGNDNGDDGYSVTTDAAGNVYTAGAYELTADFDPGAGVFNLTAAGNVDIFVSKLDASGNFVWAKSIGGADDDNALSVKVDAAGNVYTTGFFSGTTDFDPGTGTFTLTPLGGEDIFVLKLDPSGSFSWVKNMGGSNDDNGHSIALDATGNIYTTGYFEGIADFDPGSGTSNLTAASRDIFISKLDGSGNFVWAVGMGGTSLDRGNSIAVDASGNIYTTGSYLFTVDFDPGPGTFNVTYAGNAALNSDPFILKLTNAASVLSITNFTPSSGPVGTSVTITGTNFSTTPASNEVKFNGTTAVVSASTATSINTTVPAGATTGTITVTVGGNSATSASSFTVTTSTGNQPPVISESISAVPIGGIVTIDLLPLISDADNNLDLSTLDLLTGVSEQGASAVINASSQLVLDYGGVQFYGTDHVRIAVCDLVPSCVEQQLTIEVTDDIIVHNAISPNGDPLNASWQIRNIEILPETRSNKVTLYNRWGDKVFSAADYNNHDNVFNGLSNGGSELPAGTYFYRIEFTSGRPSKTGYLVLKR